MNAQLTSAEIVEAIVREIDWRRAKDALVAHGEYAEWADYYEIQPLFTDGEDVSSYGDPDEEPIVGWRVIALDYEADFDTLEEAKQDFAWRIVEDMQNSEDD